MANVRFQYKDRVFRFLFDRLSMPLVTVIRNLVIARVVKGWYPAVVCRGTLSFSQRQELKKRVCGLFVNKLTGVSRNSLDCLCISAFIGLSVTGMYNNYYFVMAGVISFSSMICSSIMPGVGNSIAVESPEKNYRDLRLFDFLYMAVAGWAVVCLLCLYQPFLLVWVGERMLLGMPVVLGLCAYFYILKTGDIRWVYHEGAGLWWECRYIMIGEAVANAVLNIVLCRIWGVAGIVQATVLSVFVTNALLCPALLFRLYFQNGKLREYWMDHVEYTLTMLLTAGLCWMVCSGMLPVRMVLGRDPVSLILCLGGRLVICTVLSFGVFWMIWHGAGGIGGLWSGSGGYAEALSSSMIILTM